MVPNEQIHIFTIHFKHPKRGRPLIKDKMSGPKVFYCTVPHIVHVHILVLPRLILSLETSKELLKLDSLNPEDCGDDTELHRGCDAGVRGVTIGIEPVRQVGKT